MSKMLLSIRIYLTSSKDKPLHQQHTHYSKINDFQITNVFCKLLEGFTSIQGIKKTTNNHYNCGFNCLRNLFFTTQFMK